jgi:hypothetical protein
VRAHEVHRPESPNLNRWAARDLLVRSGREMVEDVETLAVACGAMWSV